MIESTANRIEIEKVSLSFGMKESFFLALERSQEASTSCHQLESFNYVEAMNSAVNDVFLPKLLLEFSVLNSIHYLELKVNVD